MTTIFEIFIAGKDKGYARQAARAAFDEIDRIERLFSRFDPSSEISRVSRLRPGERMMVGVETVECLATAARVQAETAGAFDINFRAAPPLARSVPPRAAPSLGGAVPPLTRSVRMRAVPAPARFVLIRAAPSLGGAVPLLSGAVPIRSAQPGAARTSKAVPGRGGGSPPPNLLNLMSMRMVAGGFELERLPGRPRNKALPLDLDLGAVAKGYALDRVREVLADWSVGNALVHSGTSTALGVGPGPRSGQRGWPVGTASAWGCPGMPEEVRLADRALSGSGTEVKGAHIIDPRTGRAARGHLAAWASHPSAAVSDALSTAFLVMKTEEVRRYCRTCPEVWALVILRGKKCKIFNANAIAQPLRQGV
jgi:thiamine biosynthesis lipoprotein ApbE